MFLICTEKTCALTYREFIQSCRWWREAVIGALTLVTFAVVLEGHKLPPNHLANILMFVLETAFLPENIGSLHRLISKWIGEDISVIVTIIHVIIIIVIIIVNVGEYVKSVF